VDRKSASYELVNLNDRETRTSFATSGMSSGSSGSAKLVIGVSIRGQSRSILVSVSSGGRAGIGTGVPKMQSQALHTDKVLLLEADAVVVVVAGIPVVVIGGDGPPELAWSKRLNRPEITRTA
jgi:hypothetical protein